MHENDNPIKFIHPAEWLQRMKALGLSQHEVAKRAGISHGTISRGLGREGNFEQKTIEAVSAVIVAEETRLREHLGRVA
jgi:transcriptional regulator with XRE-family HTH domain